MWLHPRTFVHSRDRHTPPRVGPCERGGYLANTRSAGCVARGAIGELTHGVTVRQGTAPTHTRRVGRSVDPPLSGAAIQSRQRTVAVLLATSINSRRFFRFCFLNYFRHVARYEREPPIVRAHCKAHNSTARHARNAARDGHGMRGVRRTT